MCCSLRTIMVVYIFWFNKRKGCSYGPLFEKMTHVRMVFARGLVGCGAGNQTKKNSALEMCVRRTCDWWRHARVCRPACRKSTVDWHWRSWDARHSKECSRSPKKAIAWLRAKIEHKEVCLEQGVVHPIMMNGCLRMYTWRMARLLSGQWAVDWVRSY